MSTATSIEWTDVTWNPVRGCRIVSPECANCYAMKQAHRFSGPGKPYEGLTEIGPRGPRWTGKVVEVREAIDDPLRWRAPRRVFVNSMSDLFHEDVDVDFIAQVFAVMGLAHWHTFQVLTKRAQRMREVVGDPAFREQVDTWISMMLEDEDRPPALQWDSCERRTDDARATAPDVEGDDWPLDNVWLGVSAGTQQAADERIPQLLQTPAAIRFVSAEPLLEHIDFAHSLWNHVPEAVASRFATVVDAKTMSLPVVYGIDWVIVGGESGSKARPCDAAWIRRIVDQCRQSNVPVFVKQLGAIAFDSDQPAGPSWSCLIEREGFGRHSILQLRHRKGGDPGKWPEDLRVREWPRVATTETV